jgi:uncharacterized protein (TIGR02246 family)
MKKLLALSLLLSILACTTTHNHSDDDVAEIENMSADRAAAFNEGDASRIASHFDEEGLLMAPDSETLVGQEAVENYYQAIFDEFETELDSYYEEVKVSGDMAYGRGIADVQLIHKMTGDTTNSRSKYLNILQRTESGNWVTTHDIWNTVY